jgi:hypothetical protein
MYHQRGRFWDKCCVWRGLYQNPCLERRVSVCLSVLEAVNSEKKLTFFYASSARRRGKSLDEESEDLQKFCFLSRVLYWRVYFCWEKFGNLLCGRFFCVEKVDGRRGDGLRSPSE